MHVLRTPDERFASLPGFAFPPHHAEIPDGDGGTLRVHHLNEGPRDARVVVDFLARVQQGRAASCG